MLATIELHIERDPDDLAKRATLVTWQALRASKDQFLIALSGGSTPRRYHQQMAQLDREETPWGKVVVLFSDERAVRPDHPDSNYRMARETLLDVAPIALSKIHRIPAEEPDLDRVAREYEALIKELSKGTGVVDLIVLGMGNDGHTASLFPGHPLPPPGRLVVATPVSPTTPLTPRVTFSYEAIALAKRVLLLVAGGDKASRLEEVLEQRGELPLQRALAGRTGPTTVVADLAAAKNILARRRSES